MRCSGSHDSLPTTVVDVLQSWWTATTAPGEFTEVPPPNGVDWRPAVLPERGSDAHDHWFRTDLHASGGEPVLLLDGLATICDVYVDGVESLRSESMFLSHALPVTPGEHEIAICARALEPVLAVRRSPRARWRTKVVNDGNLRWIRTTSLGRAPGFAPGPPVVGPWRPVRIAERAPLRASLRPRLEGQDGVLQVRCPHSAGAVEVDLDGRTTALSAGGGDVPLRRPERWWPHTHGTPALYPVTLRFDGGEVARRCGFRQLSTARDFEADGIDVHVNGVRVFARGAVWMPVPDDELRATLTRLRDCGLNMVRVVGTTVYESTSFHDLCDELGMLVWQDLMFANMDYPISDSTFRTLVTAEIRQAFDEVGGRPSLAVICGNSEIEQQVGMLGLDPVLGRGALFAELIPQLVAEAELDAAYVPSAPSGGEQPFRTNQGVANYFGVGAYRRPLEDARRAEVRFASECLAFANVPDADPPDRSTGVMRDVGAGWDFADVRDHYLRLLHDVGPGDANYWERARFVTGELMAEVFGEWRRRLSPSNGGIILWSRDLEPGAGWGILDSGGDPKVAWHHLRRALAPVAVWMIDEGLNGIAIHVANDLPHPLRATLRVALYRDGEVCVGEAEADIQTGAHAVVERNVETLLGRFADVSHAYRFGAPQQDAIVASLEADGRLLSQSFRFPVGRPRETLSVDELGLQAVATAAPSGDVSLEIRSRRLTYGVRISAPGFVPDDDAFSLEPGRSRSIMLRPARGQASFGTVELRALNLSDSLRVPIR